MDLNAETNPGLEWLDASRAHGRQINSLRSRLRKLRYSNDIHTDPRGWLNLDELGKGGIYKPTFKFTGSYIDAKHEALASARLGGLGFEIGIDLGIEGYLQRGDALKLYELARLATGDVLELGTHYGLSTSIIAAALAARGSGSLETVDICAPTTAVAKQNLRGMPGEERVTFVVQDAAVRMRELAALGRRHGFVFVDHWHGYQATLDAARALHTVLQPGGFVQFHDFADTQNADPNHCYGVFQAVLDTVCEDGRFIFCGVSGCTGVFRFLGPASH